MKDLIPKLLFMFAIVAISFGYGFVSYWKEIFPYQLIKDAHTAVNAVLESRNENLALKNLDFWEDTDLAGPLYQQLAGGAGNEDIFVLGNELTYRNPDSESSFLAWIADRNGNILHAWKDPGEIWSPLSNRDAVGDWRSYPVGAHLYPNGDLLISYQGVNVFPIPMGLAKFDKDSNLLWQNYGYYHHWFFVDDNGLIYIPDTTIAASPLQIPDYEKTIKCDQGMIPYETLSILDSSGTKLQEIDLLAALVNSDLVGVINSNRRFAEEVPTCDPLHLNDVRVLSRDLSDQYPDFDEGDLLMSFRSLNGVGVLDPDTELFKWFYVGASHNQHSPRFSGNNQILMFDNYGGKTSEGVSRLLVVDVATHQAKTVFPSASSKGSRPFFSDTAGHIDIDSSHSRALASFTHKGLVWEIDIDTGDVLWEFVNTQSVEDRAGRVSVYTAKYVESVSFPLNGGEVGRH